MKRLPVLFYRRHSGVEPVWVWLKSLPVADRRILGEDIATVEYGWPVGMPLYRPLGGGLWEVRSDLTQNRIGRIIFCVVQGHMVLLHAFIKKSQKTPATALVTARKRQKEVEQ